MLVMKFGGTSVGAAAQIEAAARIVESQSALKPVVILSAMASVTDALLNAGDAAVQGNTRDRDDKLWEIRSKHDRAINELFKDRREASEAQEAIRPTWEEMQRSLRASPC
jgi:aspartate kinase